MMFRSLASSSHGNAYIISDGQTRILIECGLSHKKLQRAVGFSLSDLSACLVSHEHKDHSACAKDIIKDGIPVYMSGGTADALELDTVEEISAGEQFCIGTIDVLPFATFHDAAEPLGFLFKSRVDGESLAFATDTVNLRYQFRGLDYLAIEANYDAAVLERCERMPEKVKHRITNSHMEIGTLCDYLKTLDMSNMQAVFLLHLGDATSREYHFMRRIAHAIDAERRGTKIICCPKEG